MSVQEQNPVLDISVPWFVNNIAGMPQRFTGCIGQVAVGGAGFLVFAAPVMVRKPTTKMRPTKAKKIMLNIGSVYIKRLKNHAY
jgi:hypothetical protein